MTTKATVGEVRDAYRALRRINEEARLPQKAAWRVARLLNKLKSEVVAFEQTQLKLFRDAGALEMAGAVNLVPPVRGEKESDADYARRQAEFGATVNRINDELRALNANELEIGYDPIPVALFGEARVSANDFADAGPFIADASSDQPKAEG